MILITTIIMTILYYKNLLLSRKFEVGVLRSLGAKKRDVVDILLKEQMINSVIAIVFVDTLLKTCEVLGLDSYIKINNINVFTFDIKSLLIANVMSILITICMVFPCALRYSKKNISSLLVERQ